MDWHRKTVTQINQKTILPGKKQCLPPSKSTLQIEHFLFFSCLTTHVSCLFPNFAISQSNYVTRKNKRPSSFHRARPRCECNGLGAQRTRQQIRTVHPPQRRIDDQKYPGGGGC